MWVVADNLSLKDQWLAAYVELRLKCIEHGLSHWNVEIATYNGRLGYCLHRLEDDHPIRTKWSSIKKELERKKVNRQPDFVYLCVQRYGYSEFAIECPVTLIVLHEFITAKEDWEHEHRTILQILKAHGFADIPVAIGPGKYLGRYKLRSGQRSPKIYSHNF